MSSEVGVREIYFASLKWLGELAQSKEQAVVEREGSLLELFGRRSREQVSEMGHHREREIGMKERS